MDCPYCGHEAEFMTTKQFYGVDYGTNVYVCKDCDAYVSTHGKGKTPLGTMANKELRELRKICHGLFDPLWQRGQYSRTGAYRFLQRTMDLPAEKAHIAMFNTEQCKKLIAILREKDLAPAPGQRRTKFKSQGHFSNYCRVIVYNKGLNNNDYLKHTMWVVYPEQANQFVDDLVKIKFDNSKEGKHKLKMLCIKYNPDHKYKGVK